MLFDSASEVLETMFFTSIVGDAAREDSGAGSLSASLTFRGNPSGKFGVSLSPGTPRSIAANFLGLEEEALSDAQIGEVVCELANMLCGSVLSRLEKHNRFELLQPELQPQEVPSSTECNRVSRVIALEEGTLGLWLDLEQAV